MEKCTRCDGPFVPSGYIIHCQKCNAGYTAGELVSILFKRMVELEKVMQDMKTY